MSATVLIKVPNEIYANTLLPYVLQHAIWTVEHDFLYPVGLILESKDSAVIGGHVNDNASIILRIRGLRQLMKQVIDQDDGNEMELSGCEYGDNVLKHLKNETGLPLI